MLIPCFRVKLKDLLISFGSFVLGCVVTLSLIRLDVNDHTKGMSHDIEMSQLSSKDYKSIKLFSAIDYFLIIVVISSADNVIQRTTIRQTWGLLNTGSDVQYFFIIGGQDLPNEKMSKLKNEQIKFNDLFIMSVSDSYSTLTKKVLQAFTWFETEFNFKYILKCDDDSFVIVPRVVHELKNSLAKYKHLYWGYFDGRAHVKQAGRWKDSDWFLCDRYLPYALGGGYVLSRSLIHYIKSNQLLLRTYVSEDVSVGSWLAPLNITYLHDNRFDTEYLSRGCNNSFLVTHKQSPENMKSLYKTLVNTRKLCEKEFSTRKSYEYNWNVLPTKCCTPK